LLETGEQNMMAQQRRRQPSAEDFIDEILASVTLRRVRYLIATVTVKPESNKPVLLPPYTSKVVKTLLIKSNQKLDYLFTPRYNISKGPKPISITPLVEKSGKALWKKINIEKDVAKNLARDITYNPVMVEPNTPLTFRITCEEPYFDEIFTALQNMDGVELYGARWRIDKISINEMRFPVHGYINLSRLNKKMIIFILKTPVVLFDPYKYVPSVQRFLPTSGFLLAYNIGAVTGIFEKSPRLWLLLDLVNAALHEHRRILKQIYTAQYVYDGKVYQGVMGTPAYYFVKQLLKHKALFSLVENAIVHAIISGIGSGRAAGFGYTQVELY